MTASRIGYLFQYPYSLILVFSVGKKTYSIGIGYYDEKMRTTSLQNKCVVTLTEVINPVFDGGKLSAVTDKEKIKEIYFKIEKNFPPLCFETDEFGLPTEQASEAHDEIELELMKEVLDFHFSKPTTESILSLFNVLVPISNREIFEMLVAC